MARINDLVISYNDFKLNELIDPEQFDANFADVRIKANEIIDKMNLLTEGTEAGGGGASLINIDPIAPYSSTLIRPLLVELIADTEALKTDKATASSVTALTTRVTNVENGKTDLTGDHKGTWQGLTPSNVADGINATRLDGHETRIEDLEGGQEAQDTIIAEHSAILSDGEQVRVPLEQGVNILNGEYTSPLRIEMDGKTLSSRGNSNLLGNAYYVLADKMTQVKAFLEDTWKAGVAKFQRNDTLKTIGTFAGKVSGSTSANPHQVGTRSGANSLLEPIINGSSFFYEGDASNLALLDGAHLTTPSNASGNIPQHLFSFNVIEQVERKIGTIPATDKVQWAKDNVLRITWKWYGYGNSPVGYKSSFAEWSTASNSWIFALSHTNSTVTRISNSTSNLPERIDANGFAHFLAYAEPSNGTVESSITTDYVELEVELKPNTDINTRPYLMRTANFAGKVNGSTAENPHNAFHAYNSSLLPPQNITVTSASVSDLAKLDGSFYTPSTSASGYIAQNLFSFNVIEEIERNIGAIPASNPADRVQWVKDNVSKLTCSWHGYGSSPTGYSASAKIWNPNSSAWDGSQTHSKSTIDELTPSTGYPTGYVDSNGFVHFIAYAQSSDGSTPSAIYTDYVELDIELKQDADLRSTKVPLYEVTADEYASIDVSDVEDVQKRYPVVENTKSIVNPYVMAEGENLLPPFYEWELHSNATVLSPYELELNASDSNSGSYIDVPVMKNTLYTMSINGTCNFGVYEVPGNKSILLSYSSATRTFNTGDLDVVRVYVSNYGRGTGAFTSTNPMLTLGSESKPFVPRNPSHMYVDVELNSLGDVKDTLYYEDGRYKKNKVLERVALDGSHGWVYRSDKTGYKFVQVSQSGQQTFSETVIKSSGKNLLSFSDFGLFSNSVDASYMDTSLLILTLSDADTGWGETYTPTADDIKRYFNGWKYVDGTLWQSVLDKNHYSMNNTYTLSNYAPGYTPYQLLYKLASPVTEEVQHEGSVSVSGDTQVTLGTGIVVREKANPVYYASSDKYFVNYNEASVALGESAMAYKATKILSVYKSNILDSNWEIVTHDPSSHGLQYASISASDFDQLATYYVTYLVDEPHKRTANIDNANGMYQESLKDVVDELSLVVADIDADLDVLWNDHVSSDDVDALSGRVSDVETTSSNNASSISTLTSDLSTLESTVSGNTSTISSQGSTISTHETEITQIQSDLSDFATDLNGKANNTVESWKTVASFGSGWSKPSADYYCEYKKDTLGNIHLRFKLYGTVANLLVNAPMFTLPTGYRPVRDIYYLPIYQNNVEPAIAGTHNLHNTAYIRTDGQVIPYITDHTQYQGSSTFCGGYLVFQP
jgi:hypothetical protein